VSVYACKDAGGEMDLHACQGNSAEPTFEDHTEALYRRSPRYDGARGGGN